MTVATLNPFDLLNEDVKVVKKTTTVPVATTKAATANTKATPAATAAATKSAPAIKTVTRENNKKSNNNSSELNSNVEEKTPLRRNNTNSHRTPATAGTERQERRRTDRHSRTGYKQDGEKRMTAGKGSWGKAVEGSEQHVSVDESVAIVEQVEALEVTGSAEESVEVVVAEPVIPHLTLAQYQASLKKPVVSATSAPRKITASHSDAQILKKDSEVFVFPEIVKKAPAAKKSSVVPVAVDLSKYISVKSVSSVEPRVEREPREKRDNRDSRDSRDSNRNARDNNRNSRDTNRNSKQQQPATTTAAATKLNLKDDRSFPALGSK